MEIPYLYEGGVPIHIEPFPIGEGLTSIVVKTKQPLMLVENIEERAKALGARVIGDPAKSWLGLPLLVGGEVVGIIAIQDLINEHRFTEEDLVLLTALAAPIAGAIHSAHLLEEAEQQTLHLETAARIARDTSATLDQEELLKKAVNLVQDQFNYYHASVFLLEDEGEYAVVKESTGEAGRQMVSENHRLKVDSKSIIGHVTATGEPLIVNDISQDPTHRFNPLLPDTKAELGIPIMIGDQILGALDVQSTIPFSFSEDNVSVLQILADQLAVAVINADLFTEAQNHLAQHRLIHHVTTVAASSSGIDDALSSAVQGLRVTLGVRVAILLLDPHTDTLSVEAFSGYEDDILRLQIKVGEGITGWVAQNQELLLVNDVLNDPRYIPGKDTVRSELAVPLMYRGRLLGVLNIESDEIKAFNE
ncbi:MAG: GAF domain-containing protein, partial [Candidatus Hermodarchaeia archaeon]